MDTLGPLSKGLFDQPEHLARFRMAAKGRFGEEQRTVQRDFKAPARRGHQLERPQPNLVNSQQLGRQTDGPVRVVSGDAVFDADEVHLK